jgi:hypothetical protein
MSMQSKRTVEDVALASEIMQLPNTEGFVKRATAPDWWRVRFSYVNYPERVTAFEPSSTLRTER